MILNKTSACPFENLQAHDFAEQPAVATRFPKWQADTVHKALPILIADDDENDVFLLRMAFKHAQVTVPLFTIHDGQQAVDYLRGEGAYANRAIYPLPGMLLLDLKMPRMDGFDVLAWLQTMPKLHSLPVIILSSSCMNHDRQMAFELGAADFLSKPPDFWDLVELVRGFATRKVQPKLRRKASITSR